MAAGGGSVVTMGNGNTSDYVIRFQIIGSGNIFTGTENKSSTNTTSTGMRIRPRMWHVYL